MKNPDDGFIKGRLRSIKFAARGMRILSTTEDSIKVQFLFVIFAVIAGFYFNISATEWMIQLLTIGLVLATESLNTAIEKISDFIHPDYHKKIGFIKDIAAGSAGFAVIVSVIIIGFIYIPKIMDLL